MDGGQSRRGIVLCNVGHTADPKHVLGEVAELAGREHVAGQLAMDALRVGSVDSYGRRAAGGEQQSQKAAERREPLVGQARAALARDRWAGAHGSRRRAKSRRPWKGNCVARTPTRRGPPSAAASAIGLPAASPVV